ncbi:S-protein homolog 1 [Linum perenne]
MSIPILFLTLTLTLTLIVTINAQQQPTNPNPQPHEPIESKVVPSTSEAAVQDAAREPEAPPGAGLGDSKASWWAYAHIHMVNELTGGKVMLVHCKSKNDDLGIHSVPAGSEYEWRFRPSVLGNTLFWCHVATGNKQIVYDAFYQDPKLWQRLHMDHSYWVAKDSGIYLRQFWKKPSTDVFWKPWP